MKPWQPKGLITDHSHEQKAEELKFPGERILLEEALETEADMELLKGIRRRSIDTDPLYALFTSGSTGMPKGTVISPPGSDRLFRVGGNYISY